MHYHCKKGAGSPALISLVAILAQKMADTESKRRIRTIAGKEVTFVLDHRQKIWSGVVAIFFRKKICRVTNNFFFRNECARRKLCHFWTHVKQWKVNCYLKARKGPERILEGATSGSMFASCGETSG